MLQFTNMEDFREVTSKDVMFWDTVEHTHTKKTSDWYWVVSIVALIVIFTSVFFENYTFAAVMLFAVIVLFMQADRDPEKLKVGLDNQGVYVNKTHYPYDDLDSFHIEDSFGVPRILIKSHKLFMPLIVIPFDEEVDRDDLEHFIGYYIDKEKLHESGLQIFMESIGF
jgi:hypothetical protein